MESVKKERTRHSYTGQRWITNATNKKYLAIDFHSRCAYCDDRDFYSGGFNHFHVDHFAPKEKFPELKFVYENLQYACPYCNIAKSDTWPSDNSAVNVVGNEGFINPCTEEYYVHLERLPSGEINAKTLLGKYMIQKLKFYLRRHALFYKIDEVTAKKEQLRTEIRRAENAGKDPSEMRKALALLNDIFDEYYLAWKSMALE